jgi:hypothetical protein
MQVRTYTLDGSPGADAELSRDELLQLYLDGAPVLAISLWGAKVALTIPKRLVLISLRDFGNLTKYGGLIDWREDDG